MDRVGPQADTPSVPVAIALGSNLGDRRGHLLWAVEQLGTILENPRVSHIIETDPFDVPDPQPPYLNAVMTGDTSLTAEALLDALLALERARGRTRPALRAPRTLDLDLILYGQDVISTPALTVPHPRFRDRPFVLRPLAELAADWKDPVTGRTIGQLAASATGDR